MVQEPGAMTWFQAEQLALRLLAAIAPELGQVGHSGHDLVTVTAIPVDVQDGLRHLVAHFETVAAGDAAALAALEPLGPDDPF
jgi:hypothetical protein